MPFPSLGSEAFAEQQLLRDKTEVGPRAGLGSGVSQTKKTLLVRSSFLVSNTYRLNVVDVSQHIDIEMIVDGIRHKKCTKDVG